jgi:hypothetical protein
MKLEEIHIKKLQYVKVIHLSLQISTGLLMEDIFKATVEQPNVDFSKPIPESSCMMEQIFLEMSNGQPIQLN